MTTFQLYRGDAAQVLRGMAANSVDSVVCDPPYGISFMNKHWDYDIPSVETWREVFRVLKPGGYVLSFAGTRTHHRMAAAIEDAGFEIRDMIAWVYGSGFPKSADVSKAIDRAAGAEREVVGVNPNHRAISGVEYEGVYAGRNTGGASITAPATDAARQWDGWGTALKPALEPITVARKPFKGTVAANVLAHGTGALNIDGCRVPGRERTDYGLTNSARSAGNTYGEPSASADFDASKGRWPANLILSYNEDEFELRPGVTAEQRKALLKYLYENT